MVSLRIRSHLENQILAASLKIKSHLEDSVLEQSLKITGTTTSRKVSKSLGPKMKTTTTTRVVLQTVAKMNRRSMRTNEAEEAMRTDVDEETMKSDVVEEVMVAMYPDIHLNTKMLATSTHLCELLTTPTKATT